MDNIQKTGKPFSLNTDNQVDLIMARINNGSDREELAKYIGRVILHYYNWGVEDSVVLSDGDRDKLRKALEAK